MDFINTDYIGKKFIDVENEIKKSYTKLRVHFDNDNKVGDSLFDLSRVNVYVNSDGIIYDIRRG